jgi:UDP-2,3-diacylglucosamine hydrolase
VNAEAVAESFRTSGVRTLIHGHTHRPAVHELDVDGTRVRRIVLGDWHMQGSVLEWTPQEFALRTLPR